MRTLPLLLKPLLLLIIPSSFFLIPYSFSYTFPLQPNHQNAPESTSQNIAHKILQRKAATQKQTPK
jgi:hypothetical protein